MKTVSSFFTPPPLSPMDTVFYTLYRFKIDLPLKKKEGIMAKLETVDSSERHTEHVTTIEFPKKEGIKYCLTCGNECLSEDIICICGENKFLKQNTSEIIGGYLNQIDKLRKWYHKHYNTDSVVKMNNKRIIQYLLTHRHKVDVDKKIIDKIYNMNNMKEGLKCI